MPATAIHSIGISCSFPRSSKCCLLHPAQQQLVPGNWYQVTGHDLQAMFVCPSYSTQQMRSPTVSDNGDVYRQTIHSFGCEVQFTIKKIKGGVCLVYLRDNNAAGHPCSHFCDLFAECNYFDYSSGISWYLLRNVCSISVLFSSIIHLLVSEPLGVWMTRELPFLSKPSASKLLARQLM